MQILRAVHHGAFADEALHSVTLPPIEAGLASELVYGVLRFQGQLDFLIEHFAKRPLKLDLEIRAILQTAIYQLRYLDRIPPHAAVSEAVELVKRARQRSAAGLVNAILRKVHREPVPWPDAATEVSLPAWLLGRWESKFGVETAAAIAGAALKKPEVYWRNERQMDIGAQSIVPLLELQPDHWFLDVCAAPGNKALQAREVADKIVACDRSMPRLYDIPLRRRVQLDAAQPLPFPAVFDRILVDAPCSGTGTIGRNPEIKWRVTPEEFLRQQERQLQILRHALACLRPGGRLVYSTCSLEAEENEAVIGKFGSRVVTTGYRLPGRDPGDGFFHAVLA